MLLVKKLIKYICLFGSILGVVQMGSAQSVEIFDFYEALKGDDLSQFRELVNKNGGLPDDSGWINGETWAHNAALCNAPKILEWLVEEQHCDGLACDFEGNTPAHSAAGAGSVGALCWLYRHYPSVSMANNWGVSPEDLLSTDSSARLDAALLSSM